MSESEGKLVQICCIALHKPLEEKEDVLVQQARDLIKEGVGLSSWFEENVDALAWLREHCAEELRERAAVSKKGIELIDFDTLLPSDWEIPDWLPHPDKLEIPQDKMIQFCPSKPEASLYLSIRELLRPLGENSVIFSGLIGAASIALSLDLRIALVAQIVTIGISKVITSKTPLNQRDMQRLHARALQNPLYEALWKKVEVSSPTTLEFLPLSAFLGPGISKNNVSPCYWIPGKIAICRWLTERDAFQGLIFESVNAFQSNRFNKIYKSLDKGELSEEEFARLMEYVEWETLRIFHQIMDLGNEQLGWPKSKFCAGEMSSFIKSWEFVNLRFPFDRKNSHADRYRYQWNQRKELYFLRHPEKAPVEEDWMNKIIDSDFTPLQELAFWLEIAVDWEKDPFIQLMDKGAAINNKLITQICSAATLPENLANQKHTAICIARIKKLLEHGLSVPDDLHAEHRAWLESHVSSEWL